MQQRQLNCLIEILENDPLWPGSVAFRRADMESSTEARIALAVLLQTQFQTVVSEKNIHDLLAQVPQEWQFIKAAIPSKGGGPNVFRFEEMPREPGKNAAGNPVITSVMVELESIH